MERALLGLAIGGCGAAAAFYPFWTTMNWLDRRVVKACTKEWRDMSWFGRRLSKRRTRERLQRQRWRVTVCLLIAILVGSAAGANAGDEPLVVFALFLAALHYPAYGVARWLPQRATRLRKRLSRLRLFSLLVLTAATILSAFAFIAEPDTTAAPGLWLPLLVIVAVLGISVFVVRTALARQRRAQRESAAPQRAGLVLPGYFMFREPRPLAGRLYQAAALGPIYLLFALAFCGPFVWGDDAIAPLILALVVGGSAWIFPAFLLSVRSERLRAAPARTVLAEDPRPPVLFLRSFGEESATMPIAGLAYEESLVGVLQRIGPVVAVGRPGSPLPESGAARLYLSDADWRRGVQFLLANSGAVVLQVADTEGVAWEIEQALRDTPLDRLVLFFPAVKSDGPLLRWLARHAPDLAYVLRTRVHFTVRVGGEVVASASDRSRPQVRQAKWNYFRERFGHLLKASLPEEIGDTEFVIFEADATPRLLALPAVGPGAEDIKGEEIIEAVLERFLRRFELNAAGR